jgi:hypothetical protein
MMSTTARFVELVKFKFIFVFVHLFFSAGKILILPPIVTYTITLMTVMTNCYCLNLVIHDNILR